MEKLEPLNLAKEPIRNKRLFHLIVGILIVCSLSLFSLNIFNFVKNFQKNRYVSNTISKIKKQTTHMQKQQELYSNMIEKLKSKYGREVKSINNLIYKKTFSWTLLLTTLENSLTKNIIILSLRPDLKKDKVEMKLNLAAKSVNDLLSFIDSLRKNGFQNVKVKGERQNERGVILTSLSLFYPWEE